MSYVRDFRLGSADFFLWESFRLGSADACLPLFEEVTLKKIS